MPKFAPSRFAATVVLGLGLAGCGGNADEAIKEYIKAHGLSDIDAAAFKACVKDFAANKPIFLASTGNLQMKSMPMEVCGCQVKTITTVFKDNQYVLFGAFTRYLAKDVRKRIPPYNKKDLKTVTTPAAIEAQLEGGLNSCLAQYKTANPEKAAKLFAPVPAPAPKT